MVNPQDAAATRPLLSAIGPWLIAAIVAAGCAALLRYQLIEPLTWAENCGTQRWQDWCALRSATIELFTHQRIGWFAAACALLALITGIRLLAGLALLCGSVSLLLYAVEPGAFGALLGLLLLARRDGESSVSRGHTAASAMPASSADKPSA